MADTARWAGGVLAPALLAGLLWGCSESDVGATDGETQTVRRTVRSDDPRVVRAREALDQGRLELARTLVAQVGEEAGLERHLLVARLAALDGKDFDAAKAIEAARAMDPSDPRPYATSAELYAAAGRLDAADSEIRRGVKAVGGASPELERARGVQLICQPGGAKAGLRLLEAAVEKDPDLPFVGRALAQAHMLVGKRTMEHDPLLARQHAEKAVGFDGEDVDIRRFHAETLMGTGDWGPGIEVYESLVRDGEPLEAELAHWCKSAGVWGMKQKMRDLALRYFLRARELGMTDEQLSSGAHFLRDEAQAWVDKARAAYEADDLAGAEELARRALEYQPDHGPALSELASYEVHRGVELLRAEDTAAAIVRFEAALAIDADSLEAHNFLGHASFVNEDLERAIEEWSWVVDTARIEKIELPEPVHLKLSRAQALHGDLEGSRATLESYLLFVPTGEFVEETRGILAKLPPKPDEVVDGEGAGGGDDGSD